jgi:prophage regulatory protein
MGISSIEIVRRDEVQRLLGGISRFTLQRWVRERGFPAPIRLSPRVIGWRLAEVEAWLAAQAGGGQP